MDNLVHEREHRGAEAMAAIAQAKIVICGVGAIGSNLCDNLVRQGFASISVIDFDRVDLANVNCQRYGRKDVGALKVAALQSMIHRDTGVSITTIASRLDEKNCGKFLKHSDIVVDCFDNSASRSLLRDYAENFGMPTLHCGLDASYAEVIWDEAYKVPCDRDDLDACEYPLARNIAMLAVAVASEVLIDFVVDRAKKSYRITLKDRRITPL